MKRRHKRILSSILSVILLIICVYFLFPFKFTPLLTGAHTISISSSESTIDAEGKITTDSKNYLFSEDDDSYARILTLLEQYSYHNNFHSLISYDSIALGDSDGIEFLVGDRYLILNATGTVAVTKNIYDSNSKSHIYSVGYFGAGKMKQFIADIRTILTESEAQ